MWRKVNLSVCKWWLVRRSSAPCDGGFGTNGTGRSLPGLRYSPASPSASNTHGPPYILYQCTRRGLAFHKCGRSKTRPTVFLSRLKTWRSLPFVNMSQRQIPYFQVAMQESRIRHRINAERNWAFLTYMTTAGCVSIWHMPGILPIKVLSTCAALATWAGVVDTCDRTNKAVFELTGGGQVGRLSR